MKKGILRTVVVLFLIGGVLVQCKKSSSSAVATFSPLTAGNSWTYQTTTGTTVTTSTLTATTKDTTVTTAGNSRVYKVLTSSAGGNSYLNVTGSDYYRFGDLPAVSSNGIEELYLKDNLAVSGLWSSSQIINIAGPPATTIAANLGYSIKEKGITRTVAGKVYNNVIHVRLDISVVLIGNIGGGDFYYAEGIGLIESIVAINAIPAVGQPAFNQTQVLTAYTIK